MAYYLELQTNNGTVNFAWVAFDAITNNINAIGIPTVGSGAIFQQPLTNMDVYCSVTSVVQGVGITMATSIFGPAIMGRRTP